MKVTIRYKTPIGEFKAIEREETFYAESSWKAEGTSLIYFRLDRFSIKSVAESEIISIEQ